MPQNNFNFFAHNIKWFLLTILLIATISVSCGKKAAPTPRDEVLQKEAEKQPKNDTQRQPEEVEPNSTLKE